MGRHHSKSPGVAALRRLDAFGHCPDRELRCIARVGTRIGVSAGKQLTLEGMPASECFLIQSGCVRVTSCGAELAIVRPGEWVGEMAMLDGGCRTATATTVDRVDLYVFTTADLRVVLAEAPSVARAMRDVARLRWAALSTRPSSDRGGE
jgi:CRP-like cAMP-binding protein